ncbi:di-trans,poly-cis-decaprenylcistransferase [Candidatus Woesearchaeota archaeon]|nr:di-trans,poly-cis-decaprenylcistransferase [Candidatus Woesearchaeota archaeon]
MKIPKHIGIICDGNRRFAKTLGNEVWEGHEYGADKIEEVLEWCNELGIKVLTLWLFSTENFKRSKEEKNKLFEIAKKTSKKFIENPRTHKLKVKLHVVGDLSLFPEDVQTEVNKAIEITNNYDGFLLNIAVGYGGKQEILEGTKRIAAQIADKQLKPEDITKKTLEANMYSRQIPNVDLVIRTSGEQRTSGFLLWKTDYAEYYFTDKFWPEFNKEDLIKALVAYNERKRRFGI